MIKQLNLGEANEFYVLNSSRQIFNFILNQLEAKLFIQVLKKNIVIQVQKVINLLNFMSIFIITKTTKYFRSHLTNILLYKIISKRIKSKN